MMKNNFDTALKIGRPVARQAIEVQRSTIVSECPLAALHILQGMHQIGAESADQCDIPDVAPHPIEILAKAYGL